MLFNGNFIVIYLRLSGHLLHHRQHSGKEVNPVAVKALPRPGLEAHRESLSLKFPELVVRLVDLVGRKLTAYVGGVKDVRAVDRWIEGSEPYGDAEQRLRLMFQVVRTLSDHDSPRVVQAWLMGVNPELGDRVPVRLLREGDLTVVAREVLGAARAFIAGG
jgi:hypothetical protein